MLCVFVVLHPLHAQEIFHGCPMEGSARTRTTKAENRAKNRYTAPQAANIDEAVTLNAMLVPGDDRGRWSETRGAEIAGYIVTVKPGGSETNNCKKSDPALADAHIDLVADPNDERGIKRVVVEITPWLREKMRHQGKDWSTRTLKRKLEGKWVKVRGWLFFDDVHADEAENTAPGRQNNWRATAWEIHPVTRAVGAITGGSCHNQ